MPARLVESLHRYVRRLGEPGTAPEDAVLLDRYVAANDREAFERLMAHHGPMVLGTASRLVDDSHDAEDVFQAVFLSLARLAKTIRHGRTLPAWLHQTTCRIALKVRKNRVRRPRDYPTEPQVTIDLDSQLAWQEVRRALDEELQRLPERMRSPLVLCYLTGLTRDEAARQLGWSLGTLKRRLEEGRKALRIRLERRGIAAVGLALSVLAPETLQAAVRKSLQQSTLNFIFSAGVSVPATISFLAHSSAPALKGLAMKSILALAAVVTVGVGLYTAIGQADPAANSNGKPTDVKPPDGETVAHGNDPLPSGSLLRFGTSRFRHGIPVSNMAISADGKIAVAVNGNHMMGATRVFDLTSGRVLYTLDGWEGTSIEAAAISPDGKTIVTKQDFSLRFRDAATGEEHRKVNLPRTDSYSRNEWLTFTPDGKALAVTSQGKIIHLIDSQTGKTIREFAHGDSVFGVAFSQDGKLMAGGSNEHLKGNYFVRLWEVDTGKELRRFMLGSTGYGIRNLAFSSDAKMLATGGDDGRVRLFDVDSGKERKIFPKDGGRMRLGGVAFAPDGKTLAVAGDSIRLYDPATGEERLRINRKGTGLQFTDGGKTLTGAVEGAIYRWDVATGKALTPESAGDSVVEQILVTSDGSRVITRGQDGAAHIWDATNGKHLRQFPAAWQRELALSPDGRFLVWPVGDESVRYTDPAQPNATYTGNRLRLYDFVADRFIDRFPGFKGDARMLAFASDGKTLITIDHNHATVRVWDVAAGKELRSFRVVREKEKTKSYHVWSASLSPDGATLAVTYQRADNTTALVGAYAVRLYDVATGTERHELPGHLYYVSAPAFSPDSKLIATASPGLSTFFQKQLRRPANQVFIWDVATGRRVAQLPDGLPVGATVAAFSPDGRTLALAHGADFGGSPKPAPDVGTVSLFEVATWTVRARFRREQEQVTAMAFMPDGRLLTGGLDTTVLAWGIHPPRVAQSVTLEMAWDDLGAPDAAKSFTSQGRLLASPADTIKLFTAKVKPVEALDPKRVQRLLADLGSADFAVREAASQALRNLNEQVKPYLEATLKTTESAEVRTRVQKILDLQQGAPMPIDQLRQLRAVMILEMIGDQESRNMLKTWATGPPGASLTLEASSALKRLEARSKAK